MAKFFLFLCVLVGFGAVSFAAPDPAFYRSPEGYLTDKHIVYFFEDTLYVFDGEGWFEVESIQRDDKGTFYTTKFKVPDN